MNNLSININVDSKVAREQVTEFTKWLQEQFQAVGANLAGQMGFDKLGDVKKQFEELQKPMQAVLETIRLIRSEAAQINFKEVRLQSESTEPAQKQAQQAGRPMTTAPLIKEVKETQKNLDIQLATNEALKQQSGLYQNVDKAIRNILISRDSELASMKEALVADKTRRDSALALLEIKKQQAAAEAAAEAAALEKLRKQSEHKAGLKWGPASKMNQPLYEEAKQEQKILDLQIKKRKEAEAYRKTLGVRNALADHNSIINAMKEEMAYDERRKRMLQEEIELRKRLHAERLRQHREEGWIPQKSYAEVTKSVGYKSSLYADEMVLAKERRWAEEAKWLGKLQTEAAKLDKHYMKLSSSLAVSPQTIASWNLQEKEMKDVAAIYDKLYLMSQKTSPEKLTAAIAAARSGVTTKGGLGTIAAIDYAGLPTILKGLDDLRIKAPEAYEAVARAAAGFGVNIGKSYTMVEKFTHSVRNFARFQMEFYTGMFAIFTVTGMFITAARSAMEFSQALKDMQAVTGATNAEVNMLGETAKKVSRETPLAVQEVAKLGLQLIRAGLDAEEAAAAMDVAAKVAVVSGEDVKIVADTIATAIMAWKIPAAEVSKIGNVIAAAMNYSRLTVQDLGTAFNYLAGVASTFNISFEETNAILAVYSNLGVRASTIATGWVQLMSEFVAPSKKAREYLESLKISLQDINPEANSFADILAKLETHGFHASKALDIFQTRAGRALMFALRAGSGAFKEMEEKIRRTEHLTKGLQTAMEGPIKAFALFWNNLTAGAIQIGQSLMPAISASTKAVNILSKAIYHNIHFLTTWPGPIFVVITALVLLRKTLWNIMTLTFAAGMSQTACVLITIGRIAISTTSALTKLKHILIALTAITPGAWFVRIAAIAGALAGGAFLDKLFFGDTTIDDLAKTKNELDEIEKHLKKVHKQFQDTGEEIGEVTTQITRWKQALEEVDRIDMSKTLAVWTKYNEETKVARDRIEAINEELAKTYNLLKVPEEKTFFQKVAEDLKEWADSEWFKKFAATIHELANILRELGGGIGGSTALWEPKEKGIDTTLKLYTGQMAGLLREQYDYQDAIVGHLIPAYREHRMRLTEEKIILENEQNRIFTEAANKAWEQMNKDVLAKLQESEAEKYRKAKEILRQQYTSSVREAQAAFEHAKKNLTGTPEERSAALKAAETKYDQAMDAANSLAQELLALEQKYYNKSDGNLEYSLKIRREAFADYFKSIKEGNEAHLKNLQAKNALAEESDKESTAVLKDSLDRQLYWLEQFHKAGIDDAHAYYAAKRKLLETEINHEIKMMRRATDMQIAERKLQYDAAEDEITKLTTRIGEVMQSIQTIPGGQKFAGLDFTKDMETVRARLEALPKSVRGAMTTAIDDVRNYQEQIKNLTTTKATLLEQIILLTVQGFNKESDAVRKLTLELEKNAYALKVATATQELNRNKERIELQIEYNEMMKEANEIVGNWAEVERLNIEIIRQRNELTQIAIDLRVKLLQVELQEMRARFNMSSEENEVLRLKIEYYEKLLPLLESISQATAAVSSARLADAQLKVDSPISWGFKEAEKEWGATAEKMAEFSKATFADIGTAFKQMMRDDMRGELKSFSDYFKNIWNKILDFFADIVAEMVLKYIAGLLQMKKAEQAANLGSRLGTGTGTGDILSKGWDFVKRLFGGGGTATPGTQLTSLSGGTHAGNIVLGANYSAIGSLSGLSSNISGLSSGVSELSTGIAELSSTLTAAGGTTAGTMTLGTSTAPVYSLTGAAKYGSIGTGVGTGTTAGTGVGAGLGLLGMAGIGYGIGKFVAPTSKYGGIGGMLGGAGGYLLGGVAAPFVSATVLGAKIGSVVPVIGTIIGAVIGASIAKFLGKQEKPTFQAQYLGSGQWGFRGRHGLELTTAQKRQLEESFEDFRSALKRYAKLTNRDADVLEKPLKLGEVDATNVEKAISKSFKQFASYTVGSEYFTALQNAGEKFEETVLRVVKSLEELRDVNREIAYTIMNIEAIGTPLEDITVKISAIMTRFEKAQKVIDDTKDSFMELALSGIGGNLTIFMTSLKKVFDKGFDKLLKFSGEAVMSFLNAFDPKALEQWWAVVSKIDPKSQFKWRDAMLALEPILAPTISTASEEVQAAFKKFFDTLRNIKGRILKEESSEIAGATWISVTQQVRKALKDLLKELANVSSVVDPEKIKEMGAALRTAIEEQVAAVMELMALMKSLKESLRALKEEAVDFFVSLELKINEFTETASTAASERIAAWAQSEIFQPLRDYEAGLSTLTPEELIALIKQGVGAIDKWVAARQTEIEQYYQLQMKSNEKQIDILNKQLDVMKAWNTLLKNVKDSIKQLTIGAESPEDIVAKLTYARTEVDRLRMQYERESDAELKAKYGEEYRVALMDYLKLAQEAGEFMAEFQRPGSEYGKIYDFVLAELKKLEATATAMGGTDEQILAATKKIESYEKANNALQAKMEADIKAMKLTAAEYYRWMQTLGVEAYTAQEVVIAKNIAELQTFLDAIFGDMTFEEWKDEQLQLLRDIQSLLDAFTASLNPTAPRTEETEETTALAHGGLVTSPTFSLVGEAGPEWVIPYKQMQNILDMAASQDMKGGVTQPIVQNNIQNIQNTQNYEITVSPQITINASAGASPKEIAKEVEHVLISSLKYGKARVAVQDIKRRR